MKSQLWNTLDGKVCLYVEFTMCDLIDVKLDRADLQMLQEPVTGTADLLLDAELLARRIEQTEKARQATEFYQGRNFDAAQARAAREDH